MVETRRTSRRLQAKAMASPTSSPAPSKTKTRRTPSPRRNKQSESETASDESAQEIPVPDDDEAEKEEKVQEVVVIDSDTESEKEQKKDDEKEQQQEQEEEEIMLLDEDDEEEKDEESDKEQKKDDEKEQQQEEQEEEIMLLDEDEEEEKEEEEDVDHYAFLAASGLNLSSKAKTTPAAGNTAVAPAKPSATALLKRRLVPNQLDSGASQYREFFNFGGLKHETTATLRADACAAEEAKVIAASHKEVAHSERQRVESAHKKSAGRRWFNFESEEMTDDARRDFQLLRMRNYLDPKKFYKSSDHSRGLPKHFQMGVVVEGAAEFHSARLTNKQRRKTFTDEIMADEAVVQYTRRVASNIQAAAARNSRGNKNKKRRRN